MMINNGCRCKKKAIKTSNLFGGVSIIFVIASMILVGCGQTAQVQTPYPEVSSSPTTSATSSATTQPTTVTIPENKLRSDYATPRIPPATAIPEPAKFLSVPDEVRLLVLMGSDNDAPFVSHTNAIMLAFYHPRLAKVSLFTLPPEMFVYIPGYTMQRISVAFAVGGFDMLADTLEYNLGVRPDEFALVHHDDFAWFVNELDGLDVDVYRNYYDVCGGIPAGSVHLEGKDVYCYLTFREGSDIRDQAIRQQQVVYHLFQTMARGGKLIEISEIYYTYRDTVQTNLSLPQLVENIPLAIRLGQPDRFGFFTLEYSDFIPWQLPGEVKATVLLPKVERIRQYLQDALDFTTIAVQSSDLIMTLEYELTTSPTPTSTYTPSLTPTRTETQTITPTIYTATLTPGGPTFTPSNTLEGYPAQNTPQPTSSGYP